MIRNPTMRQHVQRILGIWVSDRDVSGAVEIGLAIERPSEGLMLSKYLSLKAAEDLDASTLWKQAIHVAVQLCRAMMFLSSVSPPFLLGSQLDAANILLHQAHDDLQPKFISTIEGLLNWVNGEREPSQADDITFFGRLLLTLFAGSHASSPTQSASAPTSDVKLEMSKLREYPSWKGAESDWKARILSVASACLNHNNVAISFGWVYEELADLQRMLEPSRQIAIVKNFRMSKRVSSLVSDAIQCLTLIPLGGDMTTGVDSGSVWTGCSDGSLWIFDASSEELLYSKLAHAKRVLCIMAVEGGEAGGSQVWTSSVDQTIKIWKAKEGKMIRVLGGFGEEICSMRAIDGNAWCGSLSGKLYIWDVRDLRCRMVHELGTVPVWSVVELQGKVWAAVGAAIVRFDAQTYAKIDELKGHTKPITCLLVVGDEVWSGGQDHTIRVWRGSDGSMTHTLSKHSQKVYSLLAYSDTCVWSGSWDKTIIVWNTNTKEPTQVLQDVHDDAISALVAVPGATQRVWSASWDKSLCVWE